MLFLIARLMKSIIALSFTILEHLDVLYILSWWKIDARGSFKDELIYLRWRFSAASFLFQSPEFLVTDCSVGWWFTEFTFNSQIDEASFFADELPGCYLWHDVFATFKGCVHVPLSLIRGLDLRHVSDIRCHKWLISFSFELTRRLRMGDELSLARLR